MLGKQDKIDPITLRPSVVDISLSALSENLKTIRGLVGKTKVMAIVKANAYGHGLVVCGRHLEEHGADFLGAAFVEEGIQLRQAGVTMPILVLGGIVGTQIRYFLDYDLDLTASSVGKLEAIEDIAAAMGKKARVHLKIDTGLERIGVHYYTAETLFNKLLECKHIEAVGVFSHFACAKESPDFTKVQLERFLEAISFFERHSLPTPMRHIAASSAILRQPETHLDMVRPGVSLYGVYPAGEFKRYAELKPVMSLRSQVVYFKVVKQGAGVSYGHTWVADRDTRVVTIPLGYGDGYSRRLSNQGTVLIRGKRYPVIGTICMDQVMVNIGQDEAYNGDEVVLIGSQGAETITVNELAEQLETNPHEIMVDFNLRLPRRYT